MAIVDGTDVRTVTTPHGQVRVRDVGGGGGAELPVLLVHSLAVDPDLYAAVVPLLAAAGHRVIIPELPLGAHSLAMAAGADLTPPGLARLLVEVLDALDIARVHVVGVDTGGALTQILMAEHRERVGLVVLTACDAYDAFPPRSFAWLLWPLRSKVVLAMMAQGARFGPMQRLAVPRPVTHRGVEPATLRRWTAPLRDPAVRRDLRAVLVAMHPRHTLAAAERNRDFPHPVLIAWGDDDRAFPKRLAERLATDLPHARRVTIRDCAAFAAIDQPEQLAALVEEHLARHAGDLEQAGQTTAPSSGPS
jgi:pimeloyl-ACP methyl ester carboxylesterase